MEMIDPQIAAYVALVVMISQAIGRAIPDSAGGVLGMVRKVAKIIGIYVTNK